MGPGVGLEVGNSIYFDMPPNQFAYWNTDDAGQQMVRALIHSGHIDCLHSYGDLAETREHAVRAIDELERYDCRIEVWVDHAVAPTNFGSYLTCGEGDVPGSRAYHADVSRAFGIRYVWRGCTTGLLGQDAPIDSLLFIRMLEPRSLFVSARALAKEYVKVCLGHVKHPRWQMHAANSTYRLSSLRDGQRVWEFVREDPYFGGQSRVDKGDSIGRVLTQKNLDMLVRRKAVWLHYTHLGKVRNPDVPFGEPAVRALRLLASYHHSGKIFVATTHRLLQYLTVRDNLKYRTERKGDLLVVTISGLDDPVRGVHVPSMAELQGITFEAEGERSIQLRISGCRSAVPSTTTTSGGKTYVSIPWRPLVFPDLWRTTRITRSCRAWRPAIGRAL